MIPRGFRFLSGALIFVGSYLLFRVAVYLIDKAVK